MRAHSGFDRHAKNPTGPGRCLLFYEFDSEREIFMKVLSFVSKYTIAFFIIAGIVITILMFNNNSDTSPENEFSIRQTTIGAKLVDLKSDKEFLISQTEKSEFKFRIDIQYQTTETQNLKIYFLNNFEPVYFSVNQSDFKKIHTLNITKSDHLLISSDNEIAVQNLREYFNDCCLLFVSDTYIAVKRFSLIYTKGEQATFKDQNIIEIPADKTCTEPVAIYQLTDALYEIQFNLESILGKSSESLKDLMREPILYSTILVSESGSLECIGYFSSDKLNVKIRIQNPFRKQSRKTFVIIFPYAYSYSTNFLYTDKATLWSKPISIVIASSNIKGGSSCEKIS